MTQTNRLIAEKIRDDLKENLPKKAEDIVKEVVEENRRIVYNLR